VANGLFFGASVYKASLYWHLFIQLTLYYRHCLTAMSSHCACINRKWDWTIELFEPRILPSSVDAPSLIVNRWFEKSSMLKTVPLFLMSFKTNICKNCSLYIRLTATGRKLQKSLKNNINHIKITWMSVLLWLILPFKMTFAVFDPSPLTVCIHCHFYPRGASDARVIAIIVCPCVCLSVCVSHAGIVSKRLSRKQHHVIAQGLD